MGIPHDTGAFGDLLDPRFQKIFRDQYRELPDMLPTLFEFPADNGRGDMRWSEVGEFGDFSAFSGSVIYDQQFQGFDATQTHLEFASGMQVTRKMFDDDLYNIMDRKPAGLATAANRSRQKHAARLFENAASVDTFFYNHSEAVSLVSDSHTTNADGVDTSSGFDNAGTSALSATAVAAARIQMVGYRDDRGNRIAIMPDELWIPNALYEIAFEIVSSRGKVDTADNNANVHNGQYNIHEWNYMDDANNWFMGDSAKRKEHLHWVDRVPLEFAMAEDLDTIIAKWRAYMRYSWVWTNWRWVFGAIVS